MRQDWKAYVCNNLFEKNKRFKLLKDILGHRNIKQTLVYAHVLIKIEKRVFKFSTFLKSNFRRF